MLTRAFLKQQGVEDSKITLLPVKVTDRNKCSFEKRADTNLLYRFRYWSNSRRKSRDHKRSLTPYIGNHISLGLLRSAGGYDGGDGYMPQYTFAPLNDIKPDMVHKATANARKPAEQFASDVDPHLGTIKTASQRYFSVDHLDHCTPDIKKVCVVTCTDYTLKN